MSTLETTSSGLIGPLLEEAGLLARFALQAVRAAFRRPFEFSEIIQQTYMVGWRSLPLIVTSGMAIGVVLSMHTRAVMERFGAEALIPSALAIALIGETGPLMTGLLVAGRVGAGIGAELGWHDIEVKRKPSGEPYVLLSEKGQSLMQSRKATGIFLTLSHTQTHSVAVAVLEAGQGS